MIESQKVLVLNRLWQAIHICNGKRAFSLLYQGHAQAVFKFNGSFQTYDFGNWTEFSKIQDPFHKMVRTISVQLKIPKVILLLFFDRLPRREVKFSKENIFRRDKYTCQYCGKRMESKKLTLDHVVPRHKGGETSWTNIVCCCTDCNLKKGNKSLSEAHMYFNRTPFKPMPRPFLSLKGEVHDDFWKMFLDHSWHD